jgi:hypothetical protein
VRLHPAAAAVIAGGLSNSFVPPPARFAVPAPEGGMTMFGGDPSCAENPETGEWFCSPGGGRICWYADEEKKDLDDPIICWDMEPFEVEGDCSSALKVRNPDTGVCECYNGSEEEDCYLPESSVTLCEPEWPGCCPDPYDPDLWHPCPATGGGGGGPCTNCQPGDIQVSCARTIDGGLPETGNIVRGEFGTCWVDSEWPHDAVYWQFLDARGGGEPDVWLDHLQPGQPWWGIAAASGTVSARLENDFSEHRQASAAWNVHSRGWTWIAHTSYQRATPPQLDHCMRPGEWGAVRRYDCIDNTDEDARRLISPVDTLGFEFEPVPDGPNVGYYFTTASYYHLYLRSQIARWLRTDDMEEAVTGDTLVVARCGWGTTRNTHSVNTACDWSWIQFPHMFASTVSASFFAAIDSAWVHEDRHGLEGWAAALEHEHDLPRQIERIASDDFSQYRDQVLQQYVRINEGIRNKAFATHSDTAVYVTVFRRTGPGTWGLVTSRLLGY